MVDKDTPSPYHLRMRGRWRFLAAKPPFAFGHSGEFVVCPTIAVGSRPSSARVYRPRHPAKSLLHQITRKNLKTYLGDLNQGKDFSAGEGGEVEFHPAIDLDDDDFLSVKQKMRG